jgi:CheY-like chemotaxis protein
MGSILVVEDPLVSKLVRSVLQRRGYDVKLATASEAEALLEAPNPEVGILLTNSPNEFLEFSGRVPLLYLTSSPDVLLQAAFHNCRVVVKPFVPEELVRAVEELAGTV